MSTLPRPIYPPQPAVVPAACYEPPTGAARWYPPVMIGADTLAAIHNGGDYVRQALDHVSALTPDEYSQYLKDFYTEGRRRFGAGWRYADIVTVLLCLTQQLKPRAYLEIGVHGDADACAVARHAPYCSIFLFDMWMHNYAGMENRGRISCRTNSKPWGTEDLSILPWRLPSNAT